jgi:hypothetical protein
LERIALSDEYFIKRNLYPNVDFYSGIIYRVMGFPTDFFPVLFAIARTSGWLAHWREQILEETPIFRPAQIYDGVQERAYVPVEERKDVGGGVEKGGDVRSSISAPRIPISKDYTNPRRLDIN